MPCINCLCYENKRITTSLSVGRKIPTRKEYKLHQLTGHPTQNSVPSDPCTRFIAFIVFANFFVFISLRIVPQAITNMADKSEAKASPQTSQVKPVVFPASIILKTTFSSLFQVVRRDCRLCSS